MSGPIKRTGAPLIFDMPPPRQAAEDMPPPRQAAEDPAAPLKELPINAAIGALEDIISTDWPSMDEEWQKKAKVKLQAIQIALTTATRVDATSIQKQRTDLAEDMFQSMLDMKAELAARVIDHDGME
jgi:hypothetical protein